MHRANVEAVDVHVPQQQREWRPMERDLLGAHPHAFWIAQLQAREVDGARESPCEPGDPHPARSQLRRLRLEQPAPARGVADDDDCRDADQNQQQQPAYAPDCDTRRTGHQNACPRPM